MKFQGSTWYFNSNGALTTEENEKKFMVGDDGIVNILQGNTLMVFREPNPVLILKSFITT